MDFLVGGVWGGGYFLYKFSYYKLTKHQHPRVSYDICLSKGAPALDFKADGKQVSTVFARSKSQSFLA